MSLKKLSRTEKRMANIGVSELILEVLKTSPTGPLTVSQILPEVTEEFPRADASTISNALSILKKKDQVLSHPAVKGERGFRWTVPEGTTLEKKTKSPDTVWHPEEVGLALISVIENMKKKISSQSSQILTLESTISNQKKTHQHEIKQLRDKIRELQTINDNMRERVRKTGNHTFKFGDVAEFVTKPHERRT